jgi:dynein heavy chain
MSTRECLNTLQAGLCFELVPWKASGACILKGASVDEAQLQLDDHAIKSQAMMTSPFAKPFHDRFIAWNARLSRMQLIFEEWLTCQVKWMYLAPVYGSEEIAKQMPKERKDFSVADGKYRRIMAATEKTPEIITICAMDGLLEDLTDANKVRSIVLAAW